MVRVINQRIRGNVNYKLLTFRLQLHCSVTLQYTYISVRRSALLFGNHTKVQRMQRHWSFGQMVKLQGRYIEYNLWHVGVGVGNDVLKLL